MERLDFIEPPRQKPLRSGCARCLPAAPNCPYCGSPNREWPRIQEYRAKIREQRRARRKS